jgi:hypothetical protein
MKLETPFIAMLISAMAFTGLFTIFTSMALEYGVTYDASPLNTEYNQTTISEAFDQVNSTKAEMDKINNDFYETTMDDTGSLFGFFKFTFKLGKQIFLNMGHLKTMFLISGQILGVPGVIVATFISVLLIVFTVSVIMIIMGRVND